MTLGVKLAFAHFGSAPSGHILKRLFELMVPGYCRGVYIDYYRQGIIDRDEMLNKIKECNKVGANESRHR